MEPRRDRWTNLYRLATAGSRRLPETLVIGAQRAGTTSLFEYLARHPSFAPPIRKEIHFFTRHYWKGPRWYRSHFPKAAESTGKMTGEATPYYLFHPHVPARVKQVVPDAKFVVLLRDPISRAYSHYNHERDLGTESLSFEEALAQEPARVGPEEARLLERPMYFSQAHQSFSYRARGVYADQLTRWFGLFPRERFHIMLSEEFQADPAPGWERLLKFLGLPPGPPPEFKPHNKLSYQGMKSSTRAELERFFEPHNRRLARLLGRTLPWEA